MQFKKLWKKGLVAVLSLLCVTSVAFALPACKGETGETGAQGEKGDTGAAGKDGTNGTDGVTPQLRINESNQWEVSYDNGATWTALSTTVSAAGEDGEDGAKGDKGDKGDTGAAGEDGATWLYGSVAPTADKGTDGDYYLDTTTNNVYNKSEGAWVEICNLTGRGITSIEKDPANSTDTTTVWIITYSDNSTSTFTTVNGTNGKDGSKVTIQTAEDGKKYWYIDDVNTGYLVYDDDCEHTYVDTGVTVTPSTCSVKGTELYVCSKNCGSAILEELDLDAEAHWKVDENGAIVYTDGEPVSSLKKEGYVAATCTKEGTSAHITCEYCNYEEEAETIAALGHAWSTTADKNGTVAATCTKSGSLTFTCTACKGGEDGSVVTLTYPEIAADSTEAKAIEAEIAGYSEYVNYLAKQMVAADKTGYTELEVATEAVKASLTKTIKDLKATGHDEENFITAEVVGDGLNICTDGTQIVTICPTCLEIVKEVKGQEATGHVITANWKMVKQPTTTETGVLQGYCSQCGDNQATVEMPNLDKGVKGVKDEKDIYYTYDVTTESTCAKAGVGEYSIIDGKFGAWKYVDAEGKALTITESIATLPHVTVGGVEIHGNDELKENGDFVQVYDAAVVTKEGGTVFANAAATCKDNSGKGSLQCLKCEGTFIVAVHASHAEADLEQGDEKAATCTEPGYVWYNCTTCGRTGDPDKAKEGSDVYDSALYIVKEKVPHDYKYTSSKDGVDDEGNTIVTITLTCSICNVATRTINAVKGSVKITTVPAKCSAAGSVTIEYKYEVSGNVVDGEPIETKIPQLKHGYSVNGTTDDKYQEVVTDGSKVYTYAEIKAIFGDDCLKSGVLTVFANSFTTCTKTGSVGFVCSSCKDNFIISTKGDHAKETSEWNPVKTVEPTCKEGGYTLVECPDCKDQAKIDVKDALKHDYKLDNEKSTFTEDKVELVYVCANGCGVDLKVNAAYYEIHESKATCLATGGKYLYYWVEKQDKYDYKTDEKVECPIPLETYAVLTTHAFSYKDDEGKTITHTDIVTDTENPKVYELKDLKAIFGDECMTNDVLLTFANSFTTCKDTGSVGFECEVCHGTFLISAKGDHTWGDPNTVNATCTEDGETYVECTICGDKETVNTILAEGHTYKFEVTTDPTAEAEGVVTVTCTVEGCGYTKTFALPKLNSTDYTVDSEPAGGATCYSGAVTTYTYKKLITLGNGLEATHKNYKEVSMTEEIVIKSTVDKTGVHKYVQEDGADKVYTWTYNGVKYSGKYCTECKKMYVVAQEKVTSATEGTTSEETENSEAAA